MEQRLTKPDPELLEAILAEKDDAVAQAGKCLQHLSKAKPALRAAQFDDLYWRLDLLRRAANLWRSHAEGFFGLKVLMAGHTVPGLRKRVERALTALEFQAEESAADPKIGVLPPASEKEIRVVVEDLRKRLAAI